MNKNNDEDVDRLIRVAIMNRQKIYIGNSNFNIIKQMLKAQWVDNNIKSFMRNVARRVKLMYGKKIRVKNGYYKTFLQDLDEAELINYQDFTEDLKERKE